MNSVAIYSLEISDRADRIFKKLEKRDKIQLGAINEKVKEILANPHHFKPLSGDMHGSRRVHIYSCFVLVYEIDEPRQVVRILDYGHHDIVYGR